MNKSELNAASFLLKIIEKYSLRGIEPQNLNSVKASDTQNGCQNLGVDQ